MTLWRPLTIDIPWISDVSWGLRIYYKGLEPLPDTGLQRHTRICIFIVNSEPSTHIWDSWNINCKRSSDSQPLFLETLYWITFWSSAIIKLHWFLLLFKVLVWSGLGHQYKIFNWSIRWDKKSHNGKNHLWQHKRNKWDTNICFWSFKSSCVLSRYNPNTKTGY